MPKFRYVFLGLCSIFSFYIKHSYDIDAETSNSLKTIAEKVSSVEASTEEIKEAVSDNRSMINTQNILVLSCSILIIGVMIYIFSGGGGSSSSDLEAVIENTSKDMQSIASGIGESSRALADITNTNNNNLFDLLVKKTSQDKIEIARAINNNEIATQNYDIACHLPKKTPHEIIVASKKVSEQSVAQNTFCKDDFILDEISFD